MFAGISPMAVVRAAVIFFTTLGAASQATGQDDFTPVFKPSLRVQRAQGEIKIDGWLEDAGWRGVAAAENFSETVPGENIAPPVETKGYLTYDDDNLYVAIIAYDNPADVRRSMCERDRTPGDDNLGFHLDTYGDADWGYVFFVNGHGVQYDALWTQDYGWDTRYDLIWESAGRLTDSAVQVEFAIPLTSLRFPNEPVQNWKVNFVRYYERDVTHYFSWAAENRDEPCELCQLGSAVGIENVRPGKGIEIIPAMTGYQSGKLIENTSGALDFENDKADGELSASAKYSLSSSSTAELAFNPDFSQVEADADQIDVNSTTALSFPEKRPFFQEGADLFRTPFDVVYTRSINDPSFAAKATARIGRTSLAYLSAYDEHSPIIVPFEEFSAGSPDIGKSLSNIVRWRQSFGENSRIGFLATDRRYDDGGSGTTLSLDGYFRLTQRLSLQWQAVASHTEEPGGVLTSAFDSSLFDDEHTAGFDGETFWGNAQYGCLAYNSSNSYISASYTGLSPTARFDNGYEPNNNRRFGSFNARYTFRFDEGLFESISVSTNPATVWNTDGLVKDEWVYFDLETNLRQAQISTHSQYLNNNERYAGTWYGDVWQYHQCLHVTPSKVIAFGGNVNLGDRIGRRAETMGRQVGAGLGLDLKPTDRIYWENWYSYIQSRSLDSDEMLYKGFTARSRVHAQLNPELSLRLVVQYNDFTETWDFDPLLTYRINPFTMFYIGTTYDYSQLYGLNDDKTAFLPEGDPGPGTTDTRLTSRQFFMKLQYLIQL